MWAGRNVSIFCVVLDYVSREVPKSICNSASFHGYPPDGSVFHIAFSVFRGRENGFSCSKMDYFVRFRVAGLEYSVRFIRRRRRSFYDFWLVLRKNKIGCGP